MRTTLKLARTGYYEIRYHDGFRTRTVSTRTRDLLEARAFRTAWLAAQKTIAAPGAPTVGYIVESYLNDHVRRLSRMSAQEWSLKMVRGYFGKMLPQDITPAVVNDYRAHRVAVKDGTVRRELGALIAALNWGLKARIIKREDMPIIPMPSESPPRKTFLNEIDEARLWAVALDEWTKSAGRNRAGLFIMIALSTAARKEAIETLTWDRVDLTRGVIDYQDPNVRVTRKRRAVVPIADRLRPILEQAVVFQSMVTPVSPYVLGGSGDVENAFKRIVKLAGFPHVRIHDLRRTAATLMLRAGVDPWAVAGVLGDNLSTVMRNYAVHIPGHLKGAVNRVSSNQAPMS